MEPFTSILTTGVTLNSERLSPILSMSIAMLNVFRLSKMYLTLIFSESPVCGWQNPRARAGDRRGEAKRRVRSGHSKNGEARNRKIRVASDEQPGDWVVHKNFASDRLQEGSACQLSVAALY